MSLRDKIFAAQDTNSETIDVPEWDVKLEVRSMSAKARSHMLRAASSSKGEINFESLYPSMVIACCFDPESGEAVFQPSDADKLNSKSAGPVERLAQAAMRVSGLTEEAFEEGKESS